jgi:hypothetical protein
VKNSVDPLSNEFPVQAIEMGAYSGGLSGDSAAKHAIFAVSGCT